MDTKRLMREIMVLVIHITPFIYLAMVYKTLPEMVATHFGIDGQADDWSKKESLVWILLGLNGFIYLLFLLLPKLAAKKFMQTSQSIMTKIRIIITLMIGAISFLLIYMADGNSENGILGLGIMFAVLNILLGNYLQAVKPNYFVGIRTPWTLESETVWRKTHRITGKIMFYGGLLSLPFLFLVSPNMAPFPPIVPLVGSTIFAMFYSYKLFKEEKKPPNPEKPFEINQFSSLIFSQFHTIGIGQMIIIFVGFCKKFSEYFFSRFRV